MMERTINLAVWILYYMGSKKGKNDKFAKTTVSQQAKNRGSLQFYQTFNIQNQVSTCKC